MRPRNRVACIPWDATARHCLAGLLLGVACCPAGDCALCLRDRARMRRLGFTEAEVARRVARARARLLLRCPACGFPPPPPLRELPPMPRLDRSDRPLGGTGSCRHCGTALLSTRRRYCDDACWNASVLEARRARRSASRLARA